MTSSSPNLLSYLTPHERERLTALLQEARYRWTLRARPSQLPPSGDWRVWLVMAGRGYGKTRTGAEWVRSLAEQGKASRIALVARTPADVRDIMIEGESGLLAICPPDNRPHWSPSLRRLTWPNGVIAITYSGFDPDMLRGPQHDAAWCDELASWKYAQATWDNLMLGLRLGSDPRCVVTTTPRPIPLVKDLVKRATTHVTRGSTYDNLSNLAPAFADQIIRQYEGTRLGRQELYAEILDDNPGALWQRQQIDDCRVMRAPDLVRIVVGVDPEASSAEGSAETGIIGAGVAANGHYYVLDDASLRASPDGWARAAVTMYNRLSADRIIGEQNNGGEMVESTVRTVDKLVSYKAVHASRDKHTRAEPIAALYEQGKVHHVGMFAELEDQMCQWTPGDKSPDRLDALVWAITELTHDVEMMIASGVYDPLVAQDIVSGREARAGVHSDSELHRRWAKRNYCAECNKAGADGL